MAAVEDAGVAIAAVQDAGRAMTVVAQDAGVDALLVEAQTAYEEASKLKEAGQYADAIPKAERALALREEILGRNHPDVANSFYILASLYHHRGLYSRAEPLYEPSLAIREATLGKNHPDVARSLNSLGVLYRMQGLYDRAEPLYQRALAIWEMTQGKNHPDVAMSLNNLATLYLEQGMYSRAEPLYERALAIEEATRGKNHPDVAMSLTNLASLYHEQGMYRRAEPLYERALAIGETAQGEDPSDVATSLNNLANLYNDQGMYRRAEPLYERALAIEEATQGKNHPDVALSLNNLATLYLDQGMYSRAEPLLKRALTIWETAQGKNHPDTAIALYNLAKLYADQGMYRRARPLYERTLVIWETTQGNAHPNVAKSLNNLAELYAHQGMYGRAEPLYNRALAIREATLGKNHPLVASSFDGLARLRLWQHRPAEAVPLFARALVLSESRLRNEALDFSEPRLAEFLQFLGKNEQRLYSLVRAYPDNADVRRLVLTSLLLFKGRSVEEAADISRTILRSMNPQDRDAFERLRGLRTQLAKLSLGGPDQLTPAKYQQRLKNLADQGDVLEADLAKRSASLRALTNLPSAADVLDRVAAALPPGSALVELVAYLDSPLVKPSTPESKILTQPHYLALVLNSDGHTASVSLGPAEPIDKAASQLRDAFANRDAHFEGAAQKLYQLTFRPLLPLLGNTRKIFLAPDGQLSLVPFAALQDGRRFLADTFDFTYLTSGRDLLPRPGATPVSTSVVVFADPDYGGSPLAQTPGAAAGVTSATTERSYPVERFFSEKGGYLSGPRWVPLPGTRQEAEAIRRILPQAQVFLGADASKERLLRLATPGILHMATHGFFLDDATTSPGDRALGASIGGGAISRSPDPLLRSGLVLAGASPQADLSSSLITALELAGLNLWGTELVVLSACNTGRGDTSRGDVKRGQGVYGLRRSFIVAGAETLVVSLWRVDDEITRALMETYYRNLLAGHGRVEALREAMLTLRKQYPQPYYWAPFIGIGRDEPLRQFASTSQ